MKISVNNETPLPRDRVTNGTLVYWYAPSIVGAEWSCPGRIHSVFENEGTLCFKVHLFDHCVDAVAAIESSRTYHHEMNLMTTSAALRHIKRRIAFVTEHGVPKYEWFQEQSESLIRKMRLEKRRLERRLYQPRRRRRSNTDRNRRYGS